MWWFLGFCIALFITVVVFVVLGVLDVCTNKEIDIRAYFILEMLMMFEISVILISFLAVIFYHIVA